MEWFFQFRLENWLLGFQNIWDLASIGNAVAPTLRPRHCGFDSDIRDQNRNASIWTAEAPQPSRCQVIRKEHFTVGSSDILDPRNSLLESYPAWLSAKSPNPRKSELKNKKWLRFIATCNRYYIKKKTNYYARKNKKVNGTRPT